jgi:hypothetical protein
VTDDGPSDEVLLELGRLVWAAMNLEDVVFPTCRSVRPLLGPFEPLQAGPRIKKALEDLQERPSGELRDRAEAWLIEARDALEERNAVVHGTPETMVWKGDSQPEGEQPPQRLTKFSRKGTEPPVHVDLTLKSLGRIRSRLEAARQGWGEIAGELWESRPEDLRRPPQ